MTQETDSGRSSTSSRRPSRPALRVVVESTVSSGDGDANPPARWQPKRLLDAPHRLGFFAAALMFALSALWWATQLTLRALSHTAALTVPPPIAHGLLMATGFMPLFIVGFLFTAGPRWLGLPPVTARTLFAPVLAMLGGGVVLLIGFHLSAGLAAAGGALGAAGWSAIMGRFLWLVRASKASDRVHAIMVAGAGVIGALAWWAASIALATSSMMAARVATRAMLWFWLAPTFVAVSHRMIPFFTASALPALDAWRPFWLLWLQLAALVFAGAGFIAEILWWPLPAALHAVQGGIELLIAAALLALAWRWGLVQSLRNRLLAMLHGGYLWLGLAFALLAIAHALQAGGRVAGLGLAPLHALSMGYFGATLIAMTTRVAVGHSGRSLVADDLAWLLYLVLQTAVLLRVAAELWPAAQTPLTLAAIAAWCAATVGWAWRYGGWMGRPRVDGRPG
ncbi:MAG: NnrS family protein [Rhodanobacter sp.]|jgi:uncharacterized protein involved in response to NO|nr:NnrS family protein [Rhodanobacter sp.]